jgi:hypothetical protein
MPSDAPFTPLFLAVKLSDIGLTTVYFFVCGILMAKAFDSLYGKFKEDEYDEKSSLVIFFDIVSHLFLIGVVAYVLRNLVQLIPFPLDGVAGFNHKRLKELEGGYALSLVLVLFQKNLMSKISYFGKRVLNIDIKSEGFTMPF